jgi:hypothetical protein
MSRMKTNLYIIVVILLLSSCNKKEPFYLYLLEAEQNITMMVGEEITLRVAKFHPQEPKEYELRWHSDYSSLIDLDDISGKVTAKAAGDAYVKIYVNNEQKGSCEIHIEGVFDAKNDVYICGAINNRPVYWKNGFVYALNTTKEYEHVSTSAIDVYNGDVYVVGSGRGQVNDIDFDEVVCWKNGEQIFSSEQDGRYAYDLFVNGNNYYILGSVTDPIIQKTAIWKNGERTSFLLENGTYAHSILFQTTMFTLLAKRPTILNLQVN